MKLLKVNVITDEPSLQDRKEKSLNLWYVLQLCNDWARYHNYLVINELERVRVAKLDTFEILYSEKLNNDIEYFTLSYFDIFKGYEWILNAINKS